MNRSCMQTRQQPGIESFFTTYNDSLSFLAGNDHIITLDPDGRELMRDFFTSHAGEISSITRVDENGIIRIPIRMNHPREPIFHHSPMSVS